jgi:hypothetical protein
MEYMERLRPCPIKWVIDPKLLHLRRDRITEDDAKEALLTGRIERDPSDRRRYTVMKGRLTIVIEPLRPCNVFCITAFYRRL